MAKRLCTEGREDHQDSRLRSLFHRARPLCDLRDLLCKPFGCGSAALWSPLLLCKPILRTQKVSGLDLVVDGEC